MAAKIPAIIVAPLSAGSIDQLILSLEIVSLPAEAINVIGESSGNGFFKPLLGFINNFLYLNLILNPSSFCVGLFILYKLVHISKFASFSLILSVPFHFVWVTC